jgi:hypothetical protein
MLVGSRDVLLLRLHQLMVLKEWAMEGGGGKGKKRVCAWHILFTRERYTKAVLLLLLLLLFRFG